MKLGPKYVRGPASPFPPLPSRTPRQAFSLIELLMVMAIVIVLFTLFWGAGSGDRQKALKASCRNNLQKVYLGLESYANDHANLFPAGTNAQTSAEALDPLIPRYTSDTGSFICPGSGDPQLPPAQSIRKRKISYAYYLGRSPTNGGLVIMSDRQVDIAAKAAGELAFSTDG